MSFPGFTPAPVLEEHGPGRFAPARPRPRAVAPGTLGLIRSARYSLIDFWTEDDYTAHDDATRVLRRQVVVVNTPKSVKYVLATRNDNFERKSPQMRRALEPLLGDGLFISDGPTWQHRRPLVTELVHKNRLPDFGTVMEEVTRDFVDRWPTDTGGNTFDLLPAMGELTARIIAQTVFGRNLPGEAARQVVSGFAAYQRHVDSFNLGYFLGLDNGVPMLRTLRLRAALKKVHQVIDHVIDEHLAGNGDAASMVGLLLELKRRKPHLELTTEALRNEAATIFMAGHETTASTLTWTFYLLANAPWAEARMREELDTVLAGRQPTVADVANLPWCRAIIEEALRLYPPVPFLARQAREADAIGDIAVEPGALILVVPWLLHRARDLWEDAHLFKPERFIGPARPQAYSYIPFAIGPRICAGLAFGMMEAVLCLATIAQAHRIRIADGYKVEPVCRLTLRPRKGMPSLLTPWP